VELHASGRLSLLGSETLAGSASSLKDGFENALRLAGCSLAEAVQMVAVNPLLVLPASVPAAAPPASTVFRWAEPQQQVTVLATLRSGRALYVSPELQRYGQEEGL
jgi:hypothetical protein